MSTKSVNPHESNRGAQRQEQMAHFEKIATLADGIERLFSVHLYFTVTIVDTKVTLKVVQIDLRINCTQHRSTTVGLSCRRCILSFIKCLSIEVCPGLSGTKASRIQVTPSYFCDDVEVQHTSTCNYNVLCGLAPQGWLSYQRGHSTSHKTPKSRWISASDDKSGVVKWNLEILRWDNGRKIRYNHIKFGSTPQLGFSTAHVQLSGESLNLEAVWDLSADDDTLQTQPIEWDVRMSMHAAMIKEWGFGFSVRTRKLLDFDKGS